MDEFYFFRNGKKKRIKIKLKNIVKTSFYQRVTFRFFIYFLSHLIFSFGRCELLNDVWKQWSTNHSQVVIFFNGLCSESGVRNCISLLLHHKIVVCAYFSFSIFISLYLHFLSTKNGTLLFINCYRQPEELLIFQKDIIYSCFEKFQVAMFSILGRLFADVDKNAIDVYERNFCGDV